MVLLQLVIFLQFADLVLMSTYNFSDCKHEAIKDEFINVMLVHLEKLEDQDSHGCGEKEGELLKCIQNTIRCCLEGSRNEDVWTLTRDILKKHCADYFPSKHVECRKPRSNTRGKRKRSQRAQPCEKHRLKELLPVLRSYMNIDE